MVRPIGPLVASGLNALAESALGTTPGVGRSPTTPQKEAGLRSDPPMSLPSAMGVSRAASAAAAPPLEPPTERSRRYGLRVGPKTRFTVLDPAANSGTLVLPMSTAPACMIRSTCRSLTAGMLSANSGCPKVVRMPAVWAVSLIAIGSPCSGPRCSGATASASAARRRAPSGSSVTTALMRGLSASMRSRCAVTSSVAVTSPERTSSAWRVASSPTSSIDLCNVSSSTGHVVPIAGTMKCDLSHTTSEWHKMEYLVSCTAHFE